MLLFLAVSVGLYAMGYLGILEPVRNLKEPVPGLAHEALRSRAEGPTPR